MSDQLILTSLVASVDSQSPPSDVDGRRSHSASEKSSVKESCESIGQACQSSTTSTTSTAESTEESVYLPGDLIASHTVPPGESLARSITVQSGRKCCALLQRQDLVSLWLKTLLASSTWNSTTCFLRWRPRATPSGRLLFQLAPSMQDTGEIESGSLDRILWPTPAAGDDRDRGNLSKPVIKRRIAKGKQMNLSMVVSDKNGKLNPTWVEWLMGYPSGHTDCADSATRSCRKSLKKS